MLGKRKRNLGNYPIIPGNDPWIDYIKNKKVKKDLALLQQRYGKHFKIAQDQMTAEDTFYDAYTAPTSSQNLYDQLKSSQAELGEEEVENENQKGYTKANRLIHILIGSNPENKAQPLPGTETNIINLHYTGGNKAGKVLSDSELDTIANAIIEEEVDQIQYFFFQSNNYGGLNRYQEELLKKLNDLFDTIENWHINLQTNGYGQDDIKDYQTTLKQEITTLENLITNDGKQKYPQLYFYLKSELDKAKAACETLMEMAVDPKKEKEFTEYLTVIKSDLNNDRLLNSVENMKAIVDEAEEQITTEIENRLKQQKGELIKILQNMNLHTQHLAGNGEWYKNKLERDKRIGLLQDFVQKAAFTDLHPTLVNQSEEFWENTMLPAMQNSYLPPQELQEIDNALKWRVEDEIVGRSNLYHLTITSDRSQSPPPQFGSRNTFSTGYATYQRDTKTGHCKIKVKPPSLLERFTGTRSFTGNLIESLELAALVHGSDPKWTIHINHPDPIKQAQAAAFFDVRFGPQHRGPIKIPDKGEVREAYDAAKQEALKLQEKKVNKAIDNSNMDDTAKLSAKEEHKKLMEKQQEEDPTSSQTLSIRSK